LDWGNTRLTVAADYHAGYHRELERKIASQKKCAPFGSAHNVIHKIYN